MARSIPLVRACALETFVRCAAANGVPVERRFAEAGLLGWPWADLERPVPLLAMLDFLRLIAERDGITDLGVRAVTSEGVANLGTFGSFVLASRTPREVLLRASHVLHRLCSHQRMVFSDTGGNPVVRFTFPRAFSATAVHLVHQHNATLVQAVLAAAAPLRPGIRQVTISPGIVPFSGAESWRVDRVATGDANVLVLALDPAVLDCAFPWAPQTPAAPAPSALEPVGGVVATVRHLVDLMLDDATPTVAHLARAAGVSVRTMQRELHLAGTSFKTVLDDARRARALAALQTSLTPIGIIADDVGYAGQASLSRAMRRWTGETPRQHRAHTENGAAARGRSRS